MSKLTKEQKKYIKNYEDYSVRDHRLVCKQLQRYAHVKVGDILSTT